MNKSILLSKHSRKKTCILPCATTLKAQDPLSDGLWKPKTANIFPFLLPNTPKWLNPSQDNLAFLSPDVFGLTFPSLALHLLGLLSWPHTLLHFYRTYLFLHLESIIVFLVGWMLQMLPGDVCFCLEIWSVQSWMAHRPVIRKVSDNGEGAADCHSPFFFL